MSLNKVDVSIIMPAFNAEDTILESINSVKQQNAQNWELIIVDDGSPDRTVEIVRNVIETDKRIRLFQTSKNAGPSVSRNLGVEKSLSEYIAFLDADDLLSPTSISQRLAALQSDDMACGSFCDMVLIDEKGAVINKGFFKDTKIHFMSLVENRFPSSLVMVKKENFLAANGFDDNLRYGEDWDLWLRMTRAGKYFIKAKLCNVFYRQHTQNSSQNQVVLDFNQRMVVQQRAWGVDPQCQNALQEFENGLGTAFQALNKSKRAFATGVGQAARGNYDAAKILMDQVSFDVLALMNVKELENVCASYIKRNLRCSPKQWHIELDRIRPELLKFFSQLTVTEKQSQFLQQFFHELFSTSLKKRMIFWAKMYLLSIYRRIF